MKTMILILSFLSITAFANPANEQLNDDVSAITMDAGIQEIFSGDNQIVEIKATLGDRNYQVIGVFCTADVLVSEQCQARHNDICNTEVEIKALNCSDN